MNYTYKFTPHAFSQYCNALDWYKMYSEVAAQNFVLSVTKKLLEITENPKRFKNKYKKFRESNLKKFPFCIVYLILEEKHTVVITSIFHNKRNPKLKYRKI